MSNIYIMEAANLFVGDHDPKNSKFLTLDELKLPDLQETLVDHTPGGGKVGVEFAVGVQKLEPTFKLKGWDAPLLRDFGLGTTKRKVFTAYGVVRDKKTGDALEAKAIMEGRLSKVAPKPSSAAKRWDTIIPSMRCCTTRFSSTARKNSIGTSSRTRFGKVASIPIRTSITSSVSATAVNRRIASPARSHAGPFLFQVPK